MKTRQLLRADWLLLLALCLFALFFRLATVMMINTGVDERDYWQAARALAQGLPYPELSHRTTRYAVILPVAAAQLVLGSHPNVYYVLPILNCVVQAGLAFVLGLRLRGRLTGFLFSLSLILFPYMIRAGSQVRPEIFSITYLLLILYCLLNYFRDPEARFRHLLWAALWLFIAYETKITNLFFLPGILVAVAVYKKRPGQALALAGLLFSLFLAETALYAVFTKYRFGELEIITQKHFHSDSFTVPRLIDLLQRYAPDNLQLYWSLPFALFGLASIAYLARGRDAAVKTLILAAASFFFFITIAVKGLHPITPVESFINRYFSAALAPVFLVLAYFAEGALRRRKGRGRGGSSLASSIASPRLLGALLGFGVLATLVLPLLPGMPQGVRSYIHSLAAPSQHPFALNEDYWRAINEAWKTGLPMIASSGNAGQNAILTCASFYLDSRVFVGGLAPSPVPVPLDGSVYNLLSGRGGIEAETSFLAARRSPFRVERMEIGLLSSLADEETRVGED